MRLVIKGKLQDGVQFNMRFRTQKLSLSPLPKDYISLYPDFHKYEAARQVTPEIQEEQEYHILNQKSQTVQIVKEPKEYK